VHPVIYAADIGSIASGNFGWARLDPEQGSAQVERNNGTEIAELVDAVAYDFAVEGRGVARGFGCPLFVPSPSQTDQPLPIAASKKIRPPTRGETGLAK
jgi:hypothetical protein